MKSLVLAAGLCALAAAAAAQPAGSQQPTPIGPPRAFAGYNQPEVTRGLCRNVSPNVSQCTIPAGAAGRYAIHAAGTSSAPRAGAKQALQILVGDNSTARICGTAQTTQGWETGARTIRLDCFVTLVSDRPTIIYVRYGNDNATLDPAGPTVNVQRLPWDGIIDMQSNVPQQSETPATAQPEPRAPRR